MGRTYQTVGIVLKSQPFAETDRLLTLLSPEHGLMRAIAPGARKQKSSLRGRVEIFVVNQFLLANGKSLDRILQAETQQSFPLLGRDACQLSAGQYLIELMLGLAVEATPQQQLYELFLEHLRRLAEEARPETLYAHLAQALFHCLALEGFAPQIQHCVVSGELLQPNFDDRQWRVGFSLELGGVVQLPLSNALRHAASQRRLLHRRLTAIEFCLLQQLSQPQIPQRQQLPAIAQKQLRAWDWVTIEHLLRAYAQQQLNYQFKAAPLVDSLWELDF